MLQHAQKHLRILSVGTYQRQQNLSRFYETAFKLHAGFEKLGHLVVGFSLRDEIRSRRILGLNQVGRRAAVHALTSIASELEPDIILFDHVDQLQADDFLVLKKAAPQAIFAQYQVDSTKRDRAMAFCAARAPFMDVNFITSAVDLSKEPVFPRDRPLYFMPNPVAAAIERGQAHMISREELIYDVLFIGSRCVDRPQQLEVLQKLLPKNTRHFFTGHATGSKRITGQAFLNMLSSAAMAPSLQPDSKQSETYLYASTRVAQQVGSGVLTFVHESTKLKDLYDDGIVQYQSIQDLAGKIGELMADDEERQRRATIGHQIAHQKTSAERVCAYMLDVIYGRSSAHDYGWITKLSAA